MDAYTYSHNLLQGRAFFLALERRRAELRERHIQEIISEPSDFDEWVNLCVPQETQKPQEAPQAKQAPPTEQEDEYCKWFLAKKAVINAAQNA